MSYIKVYLPLKRSPNGAVTDYIEMNPGETSQQALGRLLANPSTILYTVSNIPGIALNYGSIDSANTTEVTGWAFTKLTHDPAYIDVFINGIKVDTILGGQIQRQDVLNYFNLSGINPGIGFRWNIPSQYQSLVPLAVGAKLANDDVHFKFSPKIITATGSNPTPPNWISARYRYNSNRLDVEGAPVGVSGITLSVRRQDAQPLNMQSSGGQTLTAGTYYPSGPLTNQGLYTQEWSFTPNGGTTGIPIVPLVLSFKHPNGSTYDFLFTPEPGNVQLFNASTGNPTTPVVTPSPTSTTYPSLNRVAFIGNSITTHSASTAENWFQDNGMAASDQDHDQVHIIISALRAVNSSINPIIMGQGSSFELSYLNRFSADDLNNVLTNIESDLTAFYGAGANLDAVFLQISENIDESLFDETKFRAGLNALFARLPLNPGALIVMRNSFWDGHSSSNTVLQNYAQEKGYKFVNLDNIRERADLKASFRPVGQGELEYTNPGVAHHPNNAGHAAIAQLTLAQIAISGGPVTTPTITPTPVSGSAFIAYPDQGWGGADQKFIENNEIKVGFKRTVGACICTIIKKSNNENIVNDFQVLFDFDPNDPRQGQVISDKGRQIMFGSDYMTPSPSGVDTPDNPNPNAKGYEINGKKTQKGYRAPNERYEVFNTGCNTVQGGSMLPALDDSEVQASAIVQHETRGIMFYARTRPRIWGVKGELGHIILEQWVWLQNNTVCYHVRHNIYERTAFGQNVPEQRFYQSIEQENPCMYLIAPLTQKRARAGGQEINLNNPDFTFSRTYFTDQCWIGAYKPGGEGLTYYSPMNSAVKSCQFVDEFGDQYSNSASYINAALQMNYDSPGVYEDYGYMIVGTQSEAMSRIAQLPPIDQSFDFDFTKDNHRWNNLNCRALRENGDWVVHVGDVNQDNSKVGNFLAPYRAWQASNLNQIEFTMAVTGVTKIKLKWQKPGEANTNEFEKEFDISGNGTVQTYVVSTSHGNWNGVISSVGLQASSSFTSDNAKLIVKRIRKLS